MKMRTALLWTLVFALGLLVSVPLVRSADRDREDRREKREGDREKREGDKVGDKRDGDKAGDKREGDREKNVDKREARQQHRIDEGIKKGYLTPDETKKLEDQEKSIGDMEAKFKGDGKLSRDESRQLQAALDSASHCIWAEKHDTDGNQMPVFRLGKNVFAKDDLTSKLADPNLSRADARVLLGEIRRTAHLKRELANGDLSDAERTKLQAEYNELVNKYFELRDAPSGGK